MQNLINEIQTFTEERVREIAAYNVDALEEVSDLHNEIFNTDYYIVGRFQATQWLGNDVFEAIQTIKEYEQGHFGEIYTDFSEPERVANMLAYILGEECIYNIVEEVKEELEEEE